MTDKQLEQLLTRQTLHIEKVNQSAVQPASPVVQLPVLQLASLFSLNALTDAEGYFNLHAAYYSPAFYFWNGSDR